MRKIKIAQIGTSTNSHGNDIFNTLKMYSDVFEIVGYCLPENEREKFPERMADFEGFTELTLNEILNNPEIEAVTVETEEIYLTKYAILAAEHNKHIHCEKPGGRELADFQRLIDTSRQGNKTLHFGYMYRYNPYVSEVIERAKNGELGKIVSVEAQMNCCHFKNVRNWFSNFSGGIMFFLGCHLIDLILQINGTPKEIIPLNCSTGKDNVYTEDFGMAVLKYENGISFAKVNATEIGGFSRRQLVVSGTEATIEIKPLEEACSEIPYGMCTGKNESYSTDWQKTNSRTVSAPFGRYDNMLLSFAEMVRGEKQNPYTLNYELELYKTILKCCGGEK